ncbi:MAG: preprotein translocase subunit SecE [Chloroflexi bacterium RBG_16_58_8]|nr:MAG: preprotein translocase subunit SecE [Chloroflexi bacterium RBG_16_58_8]
MTQQAATKRKGFRLFNYVSEIVNELKKVVWLTRREAAYLTLLVVIVTIIAGVVLGALDFSFTQLVNKIFAGG